MGTQNLFCFFLLPLFLGLEQVVEGSRVSPFVFRPKKLFVFGDSYVDTGNNNKTLFVSWKVPYGITIPGKPSGRFSDGLVLTDYIAEYLKLKTPIAYRQRKELGSGPNYGINFAFGGTGVFNTMAPEPNMTVQINFFQQLLNDSVFTKGDLQSSLALVTLAGNDYWNYITFNNSAQGFPDFIKSIVSQLTVNMERIYNFGVRKIAVTSLEPLGCLPFRTTAFEHPLETCCVGMSVADSCGNVDGNGKKMYILCEDRKSKFFWDLFHPTNEGWKTLCSTPALQRSLKQVWH